MSELEIRISRFRKLLESGTAQECIADAIWWTEYYIAADEDECDLSPLDNAVELNKRAQSLI